MLHNKSILITGATGMIGTLLVDVLMERSLQFHSNIQVYALGRSDKRVERRFISYYMDQAFHFIQQDINEPMDIDIQIDYMFHCASNIHPRAYAEDPAGTIMINVLGASNIMQIVLKSHAKRVTYLSSVEIYGENHSDKEKLDESYCGYIDYNTIRVGYPEGKRTGEALCQTYIKKYGLDIVIPRICRVFGPIMPDTDSKILAQFIKNAARQEDIVLKSEGTQYFSYCYVANAVSALSYILLYGKTGEAYNIVGELFDVKLKDLTALLAKIAGTKVVFELPDDVEKKGFSKATTAHLDAQKLRKLGWRVNGAVERKVKKTVDLHAAKMNYKS